jgi:hypothetical protein
VLDNVRDRASPPTDDRGPASYRLDLDEAERLRPVNRKQQRGGLAEKSLLLTVVDFANVFDAGSFEELTDRLVSSSTLSTLKVQQ